MAEPHTTVPTFSELFIAFAKISISGYGGVLAWSRRMLVDEKRWMSPREFNELYALCQFLPGPNIVNLSVMYGARTHGIGGAIVAFVALVSPALALVLVFGALYAHFGELPRMRGVLTGLSAAAAGLIIATAARMAGPLLRTRPRPAHVVAVAAFATIGVLQFPLQWVLAILVPVSVGLAWVERL
jgi:chromate transporter